MLLDFWYKTQNAVHPAESGHSSWSSCIRHGGEKEPSRDKEHFPSAGQLRSMKPVEITVKDCMHCQKAVPPRAGQSCTGLSTIGRTSCGREGSMNGGTACCFALAVCLAHHVKTMAQGNVESLNGHKARLLHKCCV